MAEIEKRSVGLSEEDAALVDRLVSRGDYESAEEAVSAALSTVRAEDAVLDRWLRDVVGPTVDATLADPSQRIPAEQVFAELRERYSGKRTDF